MKKKIIFGLAILMAIGGMAFAYKCPNCNKWIEHSGLCYNCQKEADAREKRKVANEYQAKKDSIGKENSQYCESKGEYERECVDDIYNFKKNEN